MIKRWLVIAAGACLCVGAPGCGNKTPGYYAVQGKVLYKGEPAPGAVVYFHRADRMASSQAIPFGIAEQDGSFSLNCDGVGHGCPPGQYDVLVEWRGKPDLEVAAPKAARATAKVKEAAPNRQMARQGVDRLKGRYFDIAKPLLHAEVLPQANTIPPFELDL
jgi:LPS sulfotransferase NodH